jgi:hypothetical protein
LTTTFLAPRVNQQFLIPSTGLPANGGQLFCYAAGTTTKTTVFKDNAAAVSWANPIVLDSGGNIPSQGEIWQSAGVAMKYVFAPSNDTDPPNSPYATFDNLIGVNDPTGVVNEWVLGPTPTFLSSASLSLAGDQTATFHAERRIKATVTAGTVYAYIVTSTFGSGITTLVLDSAVLDSGLSAVSYGIIAFTNSSLPVLQFQRVNALVNGEFDVWQVGTSVTGITTTGSPSRLADMTLFNVVTSGTWTIDRSTDVPTQAQAGRSLNYSWRALCTTLDATVNAGDFAFLDVRVEGYDYAALYQQEQTLKFWAKSNKTGTYCVALQNSGSDRSYVAEYTVNAADTWEEKVIRITAVPSGGTWDTINGIGIVAIFAFVTGATFQTTAGAWQTGNFIATSNQTNLAAANNNYMRIADVRLVQGLDATNVIIQPISQRMQRCQRYYEKSYDIGISPGTASQLNGEFMSPIVNVGGSNFSSVYPFKSRKRTAPTMAAFSDAGTSGKWDCYNTGVATEQTIVFSRVGEGSFAASESGDLAANLTVGHWTADARL